MNMLKLEYCHENYVDCDKCKLSEQKQIKKRVKIFSSSDIMANFHS